MTRYFVWPLPLAAIWLVLPVAGVVIAATLEPVPPQDYWWHLTMGRLFDGTGKIPDQNYFLYTMAADAPFRNQPWLGQWLMYGAFRSFGHEGLVWLRNLLLLGSFVVLLRTTMDRVREPRVAGLTILIAAALSYPVLAVRTRMFALLPFAILLYVLLSVADRRLERRWSFVLILVTVFWANVHGSFVLAPAASAVVGGSLLLESWSNGRPIDWDEAGFWILMTLGLVFAGMATPHLWHNYTYVFELAVSSSVSSTVTEWLPPDLTNATGVLFGGVLAVSGATLFLRRRHVRLYEVALFAMTLVLAAGAVRSMFWWAAVTPCVVAPHLRALLELEAPRAYGTPKFQGALHALVLGGVVAAALLVQPGVAPEHLRAAVVKDDARRSGEGAYVLSREHAIELMDLLAERRTERVFHDQAIGGMLEFWLTHPREPAAVAFVDQRMELVPEEVWARYFAISAARPRWQAALDHYRVDALVLSDVTQRALVEAAQSSNAWELIAREGQHVLFVRARERK